MQSNKNKDIMKALIRKSDLVNGMIMSGCNIVLYKDEYYSESCESFMTHLVTDGGFWSTKRFSIPLPSDAIFNEEINRFEISEKSYFELKSEYGKDCKIFGKATPSKTVRDLAMCKYMDDPYDRG